MIGGFWVEISEQLERSGSEFVSSDEAEDSEDAIRVVEDRIRQGALQTDLSVTSRSVSYSVAHVE